MAKNKPEEDFLSPRLRAGEDQGEGGNRIKPSFSSMDHHPSPARLSSPHGFSVAHDLSRSKEGRGAFTVAKTILITGASSGLGAALARCYAAPDQHLVLTGRDADRLERVAAECRRKGASVTTHCCDVTDAAPFISWLEEVDRHTPIDLVIANAGISAGTGGGGESLDQVKKIFATNIDGVLNSVHPLIEPMKRRGRGQIALISSIAGFRGSPTAPAYSTSKAAVRVYGQALRGMLAPHGVTVSVICPGFIKTPMTDANDFPMPLKMEADKAAHIIRRDLEQGQALIVFPFMMGVLARLQNLLPDRFVNAFYNKLPAKK